jgi:hypothetical protein
MENYGQFNNQTSLFISEGVINHLVERAETERFYLARLRSEECIARLTMIRGCIFQILKCRETGCQNYVSMYESNIFYHNK